MLHTRSSRRSKQIAVRALALAGLAAALAAAATSCQSDDDEAGGPPSTSPDTTAAPEASLPPLADAPQISADTRGLSGTLVQYRLQEPRDLMSVKVANDSEHDVRIETLQFVWPVMRPTKPVRHDYTIVPGSATDLAVPIGEAICTSPPTAGAPVPDIPMTAIAVVDGRRVVFPVDDDEGAAARIYRRDCDRQTVEHGVDLSFHDWSRPGDDTPDGDPLVHATLRVDRRAAAGTLAVTRIQGSVNISASLPDTIVVEPDADTGDGVVELTNSRCDPHAMSDTSKPYELLVTVELDGHEVTVPMTPDATGRRAIVDGLFRRCAASGD